jgi:hypothetical protein
MGEYKGTPGELIYEYTLRFTQVVAYGASADAVFSGQIPPPATAWRFRKKGRRSCSSGRT